MGRLSRLLTFGLRKPSPHPSTPTTDAVSPSQFHSTFVPTSPYSRRVSASPSPHPSLSRPDPSDLPSLPSSPVGTSSPPPAWRHSTFRSPLGRASSTSPVTSKSPFGGRESAPSSPGKQAGVEPRRGRFRLPSAPADSHPRSVSLGAALPVGGAAAGAIRTAPGIAGPARLTSSIPLKPKAPFGRSGSSVAVAAPVRSLWTRRNTLEASQDFAERPGRSLERNAPLEPPAPKAEPVTRGRSSLAGLGILGRGTTLPADREQDSRRQTKSVSFQKKTRSRSLFAWVRRPSIINTNSLLPEQRKEEPVEKRTSRRDSELHRFLSRDLQSFGRPGGRRREASTRWQAKSSFSEASNVIRSEDSEQTGHASHLFVHSSEARMRRVYLDRQGTEVVVEERQQATFARRASTERSSSLSSSPTRLFASASSPISRFPPSDPSLSSPASRLRALSLSSSLLSPGLSEEASSPLPPSTAPPRPEEAPAHGLYSSSGSLSRDAQPPVASAHAPTSQTGDGDPQAKPLNRVVLKQHRSSEVSVSSSPSLATDPVGGGQGSKRAPPLPPKSPPWTDGGRSSADMGGPSGPKETVSSAASAHQGVFSVSRSSSSLGFGRLFGSLSSTFSRRRNSASSKSSVSPSVAASVPGGSAASAVGASERSVPSSGTKPPAGNRETRGGEESRDEGPIDVLACYSFRASEPEDEHVSGGGDPPLSSVLSLDSDTASLLSCHSLSSRSISPKPRENPTPHDPKIPPPTFSGAPSASSHAASLGSAAGGAKRAKTKSKEATLGANRRFGSSAFHQTPAGPETSPNSSSGAAAADIKAPGTKAAPAGVARRASAAPVRSSHHFSEPQMPPPKARRSSDLFSFGEASDGEASSERLWTQIGGQALRTTAQEKRDANAKRELEIFASEFLLSEDEARPRRETHRRSTNDADPSTLQGGGPAGSRHVRATSPTRHRSLGGKASRAREPEQAQASRKRTEQAEASEGFRKRRSHSYAAERRRGRTRDEAGLGRGVSRRQSSVVAVHDGRLISSAGAAKATAAEEEKERSVRPRGSGHRRSTEEEAVRRVRSRKKGSTELAHQGSSGFRHSLDLKHHHRHRESRHVLRSETSPAGLTHQNSQIDYEASRPPDLSVRLQRHRTLQSPLLHLPSSPSLPALLAGSRQSSWSVGEDEGRHQGLGRGPPQAGGLKSMLDEEERAELRRELAELEAREKHLEKLRNELKRMETRLAQGTESEARPTIHAKNVRNEPRGGRENRARLSTRRRNLRSGDDSLDASSKSNHAGAESETPLSDAGQGGLTEYARSEAEGRQGENKDSDASIPYRYRPAFGYEASHGATFPCLARLPANSGGSGDEAEEDFCHLLPQHSFRYEPCLVAPPPAQVEFVMEDGKYGRSVRRSCDDSATGGAAPLWAVSRCPFACVCKQRCTVFVSATVAFVRVSQEEAFKQDSVDAPLSSSCMRCDSEATVEPKYPDRYFRVEAKHGLFSSLRLPSSTSSQSLQGDQLCEEVASLALDSDKEGSELLEVIPGDSGEESVKICCIEACFESDGDQGGSSFAPKESTEAVTSGKKAWLPSGFTNQRQKRGTVAPSQSLSAFESPARRVPIFGTGVSASLSSCEFQASDGSSDEVFPVTPERAVSLVEPETCAVSLPDTNCIQDEPPPLKTHSAPASAIAGRDPSRKNLRLCVRFAAEIEEILRLKEEEEEAQKAAREGEEWPEPAPVAFDWNQTCDGPSTESMQVDKKADSSEARRMTTLQRLRGAKALGSRSSFKSLVTRLRSSSHGQNQGKQDEDPKQSPGEPALKHLRQQFAPAALRNPPPSGVYATPALPRRNADEAADTQGRDSSHAKDLNETQNCPAGSAAGGVLFGFMLGRRSGEGSGRGWGASREDNRDKSERRPFWLRRKVVSERDT
ncbi:hypothetical protein TGRUB_253560 [Toxoplasma gondii RUB]|uniref:Uncharacterized protein n=1 Tax=Toxoplasma gondii RUB TaxID=935652 RepID=A0A086LTW6_TOXGO|nr:hypothetical protein TGRUB_253560 [Toxoplasma gondii RUB]